MADVAAQATDDTGVGSYFVANYPPFSVWTADAVAKDALPALARAAAPDVALGLYLHIPFCRKRCHFCYFRVYTDKNAQQVNQYVSGNLSVARRPWRIGPSTSCISVVARRRFCRHSSSRAWSRECRR
jgi:hypothetical protein